jgi:hypothetical protein
LNFAWMLQFKLLWVLLFGVDWVTYSIFVLVQHLHLQMLDLDLCFIFIFRVQTFTYPHFCTLRYIGIQFLFFLSFFWNLMLELELGFRIVRWGWISNSKDFEFFEFKMSLKKDKKK